MKRACMTALLCCLALAGCHCTSRPDPVELKAKPLDLSAYSYEGVASAMNARAEALDRFWAATITKVWYIGQEGEDEVDQLDGDLHIVQPNKLGMTLQKLGIDGAVLGANERFYWYVDLLADEPVAYIGTHENANPDQLGSLGVPVHPLDLLLLLGFSKVPAEPLAPLRESRNGGYLVVTAPARWGIVEYTVDPDSFEPRRVVIRRAPRLPPVLTADMEDAVPFDDRLDPAGPQIRIPERVWIDMPEIDARMSIRFLGAQVSRRKPDERAFDLSDTLSRHRVRVRRDLDVMHERMQVEER